MAEAFFAGGFFAAVFVAADFLAAGVLAALVDAARVAVLRAAALVAEVLVVDFCVGDFCAVAVAEERRDDVEGSSGSEPGRRLIALRATDTAAPVSDFLVLRAMSGGPPSS